MITPSDIQSIEFGKSVRGYNSEEVDQFLDKLTVDFETVIKENEALRNQIGELNEKIEKYKSQEGAMLSTLEAAKALMNDISASAEKRADILIRNAELDADLKLRQARENVERLKEEEAQLSQRVSTLKSRLKATLEAELERIEDMNMDVFGVPASKDFKAPEKLDESSESFLKGFDSSFDTHFNMDTIKDQDQKVSDLTKTITNMRKNQ